MKSGKYISLAVFVLITAIFSYIFMTYPYAYDDYAFKFQIEKEYHITNPDITTWESLIETFHERYIHDNARIGNFTGIASFLLPRWIPRLGTCLCFILGYLLMMRYARIRMSSLLPFTILSFLLVFAPIWQDNMFCQIFTFNYVWSIPLLMGVLCLFMRDKPLNPWLAGGFALFTGMWHETLWAVILGGSAVTLLVHRDMARRDRVAILIGATLAAVWFFCAPSWYARDNMTLRELNPIRLVYMWSFVIYAVLWLSCLIDRRRRSIALAPRALFMMVGGTGLSCIIVYSDEARAAMAAMILASATLPWLMTRMWPDFMKGRTTGARILTVLIIAIIAMHLGAVCRRTDEIKVTSARLVSEIRRARPDWAEPQKDHDTLTVFLPVKYSHDNPYLTLTRPERQVYVNDEYTMYTMAYYHNYIEIKIVPEELKYYRAGMGTPLKGSKTCRLYKGHIVSDCVSDTTYLGCRIRYGFHEEYTAALHAPFTGADGHEYDYILPRRSLVSTYMGRPTYFSLDPLSFRKPKEKDSDAD